MGLAGKARRDFELLDEGVQRGVQVVGRALVMEGGVRFGGALAQSLSKARLANARLSPDEDDLPSAALRPLPALGEQRLLLLPDQLRQRGPAVSRGKRPAAPPGPINPPDAHWLWNSLQRAQAEIGEAERIGDETPGRGSHHDLVRSGLRLQSCRQVGGFSHCQPRLGVAVRGDFAYHYGAGRQTDPNRERFGRADGFDGLDHLEPEPTPRSAASSCAMGQPSTPPARPPGTWAT